MVKCSSADEICAVSTGCYAYFDNLIDKDQVED
jgi:hypothetical protein